MDVQDEYVDGSSLEVNMQKKKKSPGKQITQTVMIHRKFDTVCQASK